MMIADCGLDEGALAAQVERYRRLGAQAAAVHRSPLELTVQFATEPEPELLRTTLEVERGCCAFFALDYAEADRRLTVSVPDPTRAGALDAIQAALTRA